METSTAKPSAKTKILNAAFHVIRSQGYSATTVDDLCAAAGVTKGAFFHHFDSKEALAVAAARHWSTVTGALFAAASYHRHEDPLDRVLGYVELRKELIRGPIADFTCLVGTMVQETYDAHPAIREACRDSIFAHSALLTRDIAAARKRHAPKSSWSPRSLALHTQAVIQGAYILAKSDQSPELAAESLDHLRRYIEFLFATPLKPTKKDKKR